MYTYKTKEVADIIGIHSNTVRLYETIGFIPRPIRKSNGYRIFTDFHIEQLRLARTALKVELLQNGLRKKAVEIIKVSAAGEFDRASCLIQECLLSIKSEQQNAEEAIAAVQSLISGDRPIEDSLLLKRKETAKYLKITIDTLRNWEMNGLIHVKRKQNGYRVYTGTDIQRLKIIRSLRCANYSLAAILRILDELSRNPKVEIKEVIDTPKENEDIISVCDRLLTSLKYAEQNVELLQIHLKELKKLHLLNPPL